MSLSTCIKRGNPSPSAGWLSPKLLTCLRLAQITDGERKGRREGISVLSDGKHTPARQKTERVCALHVLRIPYTKASITCACVASNMSNMNVFLGSESRSPWTLKITCQVTSSMCPPYCCWYGLLVFLLLLSLIMTTLLFFNITQCMSVCTETQQRLSPISTLFIRAQEPNSSPVSQHLATLAVKNSL